MAALASPAARLWAARLAVWALAVVPLALLITRLLENRLGANPIETLEHSLGIWALRFLILGLAMTPLRSLTGWSEPLKLRRTIGLWAYAYICLHFAVYIVFDLNILYPAQALAKLAEDLTKRLYITVGFASWLFLLPLAITSTDGWQRRLKRKWKTLHKLVYPAAILGVLHFIWLVKKDVSEPLIYAAILAVLLAWRWPWPQLKALVQRGRAAPVVAGADRAR
ncbi:sulfite oxidase heme-binding subunit YedZ [Nevskia sp.]|uniref:sulfite oxidase heme-binding subunit YedZ n=1 Tax=Nevskia sp. TaxID=1929292 RepID=UPI0025EF931A|nr:protein-methionine-sulfoxide reductase heme-binding subunit MsrQ [Nevskia sp.]